MKEWEPRHQPFAWGRAGLRACEWAGQRKAHLFLLPLEATIHSAPHCRLAGALCGPALSCKPLLVFCLWVQPFQFTLKLFPIQRLCPLVCTHDTLVTFLRQPGLPRPFLTQTHLAQGARGLRDEPTDANHQIGPIDIN